MTNTMILRFVGKRQRAFTVSGPVSGDNYYVDPASGEPVVFAAADGKAILKRDPLLWKANPSHTSAEQVLEAATSVEQVEEPPKSKG